jgi:hypothetical protein
LARENSGWGYDRIVGALANLGHQVSDQTVGNILRRHGIGPVPQRSKTTTWKDFIRRHMDVLAGIDFFTVEVLTWRGLVTYYVLFFIHLESRRGLHRRNHGSSGCMLDAVESKNPIRMKSKDDGSRGPGAPDRGVTPRYIQRNHLVTSV